MILHCTGCWFIAQPWGQIVGFRNRIVHEYAEVDTDIVWAILQNEVPRLLEESESLLEEFGYGN